MLPQILALSASASFAFLIIFIQLGLNAGGTPIASTVINTGVNAIFLWILVAAFGLFDQVFTTGIWLFFVIGIFVPGLARYFYFYSTDHIGTSRAATLKSLTPLFSVLVAFAGFGEELTIPIVAGTALIVGGIILVSMKADAQEAWSKLYLIFPVMSALLFAMRDNLARFGFQQVGSPLVGATAAATGGFACMLVLNIFQGGLGQFKLREKSTLYFVCSGILAGLAYLGLFTALSYGRVVTVAPLAYADPLLVPILSYYILRGHERLSWKIGLGAVAVVAGIMFIMIYRGG